MIGELAGSSATMRVVPSVARKARDTPISMPAVPTAPQNVVIGVSICSSSSPTMRA
jgi:hypothetical protein